MASTWPLLLAVAWAGTSGAQTAPDPFAECPAFPAETAASMRWDVLRVPNMLLCRAISTEDNVEAFALTVSEESPFKPRRADRAESGTLNGREVQWYRGNVPSEPTVMIREALIELREGLVIHVSMRANDAETLAKHQRTVLSLPFPPYQED